MPSQARTAISGSFQKRPRYIECFISRESKDGTIDIWDDLHHKYNNEALGSLLRPLLKLPVHSTTFAFVLSKGSSFPAWSQDELSNETGPKYPHARTRTDLAPSMSRGWCILYSNLIWCKTPPAGTGRPDRSVTLASNESCLVFQVLTYARKINLGGVGLCGFLTLT